MQMQALTFALFVGTSLSQTSSSHPAAMPSVVSIPETPVQSMPAHSSCQLMPASVDARTMFMVLCQPSHHAVGHSCTLHTSGPCICSYLLKQATGVHGRVGSGCPTCRTPLKLCTHTADHPDVVLPLQLGKVHIQVSVCGS
jgi:hypothetical protein